jgi:SAM-dependent methyltransferase
VVSLSLGTAPQLARSLVCPRCSTRLELGSGDATCAQEHHFPVVEAVPVLLCDEELDADPQYAAQRRYFGAEFARYETYRLESWRRSYLERLRAAGLRGAERGPVLDVGVGGSGYTVIEAARAGQEAAGCDLTLEALLAARRFAHDEGVAERTLWACCSAERLPFAADSFASVLAIAVLEHVPDDRAALREAARVVRPGGHVWVTVPHALRHVPRPLRPPSRRHDRRLGHLRRYEADELAERGREAGSRSYASASRAIR